MVNLAAWMFDGLARLMQSHKSSRFEARSLIETHSRKGLEGPHDLRHINLNPTSQQMFQTVQVVIRMRS